LGGAISHYRERNLDGRFVVRFLIPAVLGAQLGAQLAVIFPEAGLSIAFSMFLGALAYTMRGSSVGEARDTADAPWAPVLGVGGLMGLLSGLFGVGGGVLFVPAQVQLFGVPIKRAVGNSMLLVLLVGLSAVAAHAWLGTVAWREGAILIVGGAVGLRGGLWLLSRVSSASLRGYLVWLLAAMAVYMLARGLFVLAGVG
ncbi:MAG: sulfite exporter TauE/SafE family protein, partial [Candidatus Sericytochromatia bacterium]